MAPLPAPSAYDRLAPRYDRRWRHYLCRTLDVLEREAVVQPHERVLDVGCGTGVFAARLVAHHPAQRYLGVDPSEKMLAQARRKLAGAPHAEVRLARAEALPVPDGAFDVVASASALHYVADQARALAEMRRAVAPDGRVVVLDWCQDFFPMRTLDAVLRHVEPGYARTLTPSELHGLMAAAGLRVVRTKTFRVRFYGLMVLAAVPA